MHNFFKLCGNSGATFAPQIIVSFLWYFFKEKKWLNRVSEVMLSYLQNLPIYYLSGKYKFSIGSLTKYCYTDVYSCAIFRAIQTFKKMFGAWWKFAQNFFSPEFGNNFYLTFYLLWYNLFNTTFKSNIISPLYVSFKTLDHLWL